MNIDDDVTLAGHEPSRSAPRGGEASKEARDLPTVADPGLRRDDGDGEAMTSEIASTIEMGSSSGIAPRSFSDVATVPPDDDATAQATIDIPSVHLDGDSRGLGLAGDVTVEDPKGKLGPVRLKAISPDDASRRYSRTRLHAQGGLGVVWSVVDRSVGREVALKELRGDRGDDAKTSLKFLQEARITGQLEHPSIVPIYEVAQDPETGRPYYTMRFIRGKTLADSCADYYRGRTEGKDDPVVFRGLLSAFVGVCQGVAYAHSRGVIHRDLKGQNVVLGEYGEAIVLDWGLAKILGEPDDDESAPVVLDPNDASHHTREGQVSGTPTYMPPEQAHGQISKIDRRSDIYSLGAILYEILTGQPPFGGGTLADVLKRVKMGDLRPPLDINPLAPRPLAAVCLKSMAKERDDRYQSAADLADEVQRFLAGEPVLAYPEPWTAKAQRWARKHKTAVASAAVLLVASLIGLIVGDVLIGRERDRARAQREIARRAVDEMYTDVAEQWLEDQSDPLQQKFVDRALAALQSQDGGSPTGLDADEPARADRVDVVQKAFLERSLAYYHNFANGQTDGEGAEVDVAQAGIRAAGIHRKLGRSDDAEALYRKAITTLAARAAADPDDLAISRVLAVGRARFGTMLVAQGRFAEADSLLDLAEKGLAEILTSTSVVDRDRLEWGRVVREQAERLKLSGKTTEAETRFRTAIAELARLVGERYPGVEARHELALAQDALGVMLLLALDRQQDAASLLESAMRIETSLVKEAPTVPHLRAGLGKTANTLGLILRAEGKTSAAVDAAEISLANYQRLGDDFPGRLEYQRALARAFLNRGTLDQDEGLVAEAATRYEASIRILDALIAQAPEIAKHHRDLGNSLNNLGAMRERADALDDAISLYDRAAAIDKALVAKYADVPEYQECLAIDERNLARALSKRSQNDDPTRAVALASSALATFETLATAHPTTSAFRRGLADSQFQLGSIHLAAGRAQEAETLLRAAVQTHRDLISKHGETLASRRAMIESLVNLAELGTPDAEALDREAMTRIQAICNSARGGNGDRFTRAVVHNNLGEILQKKGKLQEASSLFAEATTLFEEKGLGGNEPQRMHYVAYVCANQGRLAEEEGRTDAAVAFYRRAIDADRDASKLSIAYRPFLLEDFNRLAALLVKTRNHRDAANLAFEMVQALPEGASTRVEASGLLSRCMGLARADDAVPEAERNLLAKVYAKRGMAQLRVAIDSGYKRVETLKDNADIQKLLAESEANDLLPDLSATPSPSP